MMNEQELTKYLDEHFKKLLRKVGKELSPKNFFKTKWDDCEEVPISWLHSHTAFLNCFEKEKQTLYLLQYSLQHLKKLVDYYCKHATADEMKNTLIMLSISDWEDYDEEQLRFYFFVTYKCHTLFIPSKPYTKPWTKESAYIIKLLNELNVADDFFVFDGLPPIDTENQRVVVGFKQHPNPNLVTLDHFVEQ